MAALSPAQIEFLRFHVAEPTPRSWIWLQADGTESRSVRTHAAIAARKGSRANEVRREVTLAEYQGLKPFWARLLVEVNDEGLALLREAP